MKPYRTFFCRAINSTLWATFFFVANDILFAFTKSSEYSEINNDAWVTSPIFLLVTSWFSFAAAGLVLCSALSVLLYPVYRWSRRSFVPLFLYVVPALFISLTALAIVDHFTFFRFGFSSINHYFSDSRTIDTWYLCGFLLFWACSSFYLAFSAARSSVREPSPTPSLVLASGFCVAFAVWVLLPLRYEHLLPLADAETLRNQPNIFILTIESASADVSSAYGKLAYDTTPFFREFAQESVVADNYFSNGYNSRESVNSVISGLHPFQHQGVYPSHIIPEAVSEMNLPNFLRRNGFPYEILRVPGPALSEYDYNFILSPVPHLFRTLREEQYTVMSIIGVNLQRFNRIVFDTSWPDAFPGIDGAKKVIERAQKLGHPFFVHIHAIQSHGPYDDCDAGDMKRISGALPTVTKFEELCYLVKLGEADKYARSFDELLHSMNVADNTVFVIVGDHEIPYVYTTQSTEYFRDMRRVPLLIRLPHRARAGDVIHSNVETIDIAPTILAALGLPPMPWSKGVSILDPDFDLKNKVRPILIDQGYKNQLDIVVCDWVRSTDIGAPKRKPNPDDWIQTSFIKTHCDKNELPSVDSIVREVHAVQWKLPKYP